MKQLFAPWRLQYVSSLSPESKSGCFFCDANTSVGEESVHLLLGRGKLTFAMLNRYPYNNGHIMIAPNRHIGNMEEMTIEEGSELFQNSVIAKQILQEVYNPDGFNLGINQGKCGGAGILDHLHLHIVPRWTGDTNFMPLFADVRVIPEGLAESWAKFRPLFLARGLS